MQGTKEYTYIDGGLDDETAQNLNGLFHEATLEAVMGAMQIGKEKHGTQEDECHIAENHVAQHQTISDSNIPAGKADVENLQADKAIQDKPSKASVSQTDGRDWNIILLMPTTKRPSSRHIWTSTVSVSTAA